MSDEKLGIKETKEALVAGFEVGLLATKRFKDGLQVEDFAAFYEKFTQDEEFKAIVKAGYDNAKAIPAEVADVDLMEGVELSVVAIKYVPKFIDALKPE